MSRECAFCRENDFEKMAGSIEFREKEVWFCEHHGFIMDLLHHDAEFSLRDLSRKILTYVRKCEDNAVAGALEMERVKNRQKETQGIYDIIKKTNRVIFSGKNECKTFHTSNTESCDDCEAKRGV